MKKISIMLIGILAATGAVAQSFKHKLSIAQEMTDRRERSRENALKIISSLGGTTQAKSTAAYERMVGFSDYQLNNQSVLTIVDSGGMSYSGMRGSGFNFNSMSIGYYSPLFAPMMPGSDLAFKADVFNIYMNSNSSSIVGGYTFTYNNDENITEVYIQDYQGNPDTRLLISYTGLKPNFAEMLTENGSNWDTVFRRYYTYDSNNLLVEDSTMEYVNNAWSIYQKYQYTNDMNGNIIQLGYFSQDNGTYGPYSVDSYAYDNNDRMQLALYSYYDTAQDVMVLDSRDTFQYTSGLDFFIKDNYSTWDTLNDVWVDVAYVEKHLNTQMLPDTSSVFIWDGTVWEPYYYDVYNYTSYGNPVNDTLWTYTNQQLDEDPAYVGHYYYQTYFDLHVNNAATQSVINVYPNPANDILNISNSGNASMQIQLVNALGQVVKTARSSAQAKLSMGDLSAGMYWLTVADANGNKLHQQAVVKQ